MELEAIAENYRNTVFYFSMTRIGPCTQDKWLWVKTSEHLDQYQSEVPDLASL